MNKVIYHKMNTTVAVIITLALVGQFGLSVQAAVDAPRGVVVDGGATPYELRVSWINPDSDGLDHINIYLSNYSSANPANLAGPPLNEYGLAGTAMGEQAQPNARGQHVIAGLSDQRGTTNYYYVYIKAVDTTGAESPATTPLRRQTGISQDLTSTEEPTSFRVTTTASSSISLAWTNPPQDDLYRVALYRSTIPNLVGQAINLVMRETVLPNSASTWTDTGLAASTTYYYKLVTEDTVGNLSDGTAISAATTAAAPPASPPPATPTPPVVSPTPEPTTPPSVLPNPNNFDYRAQWISQSGSLSADKTAHVVHAQPGATITFELTLKNTGNAPWLANIADNANEFRIGTWRAQDRTSLFHTANWISSNRVAQLSQDVASNATVTLNWTMTVPTSLQPGTYREYFRPVAEYCEWFGPDGIFWDVIVS